MNIELHIEELVLHGFDAKDRRRIGRAVRDELARLLGERGAALPFEQGSHQESVDGGSFQVREGEKANSIGARIGQAVYAVMAGNREGGVTRDKK